MQRDEKAQSSGDQVGAGGRPKTVHVKIHRERCIGAGHCVQCDPDVFSQDEDDGIVILTNPEPSPAHYDAVKEAEQRCPSSTIQVVDD